MAPPFRVASLLLLMVTGMMSLLTTTTATAMMRWMTLSSSAATAAAGATARTTRSSTSQRRPAASASSAAAFITSRTFAAPTTATKRTKASVTSVPARAPRAFFPPVGRGSLLHAFPSSWFARRAARGRTAATSPASMILSNSKSTTTSESSFMTSTSQSSSVSDDDHVVIMQNALFRVRDVNRKPPTTISVLDFVVDDCVVGKVTEPNAELLVKCGGGDVFQRRQRSSNSNIDYLTLSDKVGPSFEDRTSAVGTVMQQFRIDGIVKGWRDELYPVAANFYQPPFFAMERAAVPLLGALEYGVHIIGLVVTDSDSGNFEMWMARRSAQKSKYPGMLDHLVAGGQPIGISLLDNAIKECYEEAGIPEDMARQGLRPVSAISYETYVASSQSISRAVLFNYDLYLPKTFVPVPVDGEVDEFFRWTVPQLLESLDPNFHDPIKPNCYSVIVDFLVRHGHLQPDTPGYLDVVRELRSGECR